MTQSKSSLKPYNPLENNRHKTQWLQVFIKHGTETKTIRYVGTAPKDENFALVAKRFGIKPNDLINGEVRTRKGIEEWLIVTI